MMIDFSSPVVTPGVIAFPVEFTVNTQPTTPGDLRETIVLGGSSTGGAVAVAGTVDQPEG